MLVVESHPREEPSVIVFTTIGLDLAKHVFQVQGIAACRYYSRSGQKLGARYATSFESASLIRAGPLLKPL
jgi:hypothetical protein